MRTVLVLAILTLVGAGCLESATVICPDRTRCRAGMVCDTVHGGCILPDQEQACTGVRDGTVCDYLDSSGVCDRGICVAEICGDGFATGDELCDDGNNLSGDGCSADCSTDERCGNGVLDEALGEECDCSDGSRAVEGCIGTNTDQGGFTCTSDCRLHCGDGELRGIEQCDPGRLPDTYCVDFGFNRGGLDCASCFHGFSSCAYIGWQVEDINVLNLHLAAIHGNGTDTVAVGSIQPGYAPTPLALRWTDGAWTIDPGPNEAFTVDLGWNRGVWVAPSGEVFIAREGSFGSIVQLVDGQWQGQLAEKPGTRGVWGRSSSEVYAVGGTASATPEGFIAEFDGVEWALSEGFADLNAISGNGDVVVAVGERDGVAAFVCHDGDSWMEMATTVDGFVPVHVWVGDDGLAWVSSGTSLATFNCAADEYLEVTDRPGNTGALWGFGTDNLFAAGPVGTVFELVEGQWLVHGADTNYRIAALWGTSPSELFGVAQRAQIVTYSGSDILPPLAPFTGRDVWVDETGAVYGIPYTDFTSAVVRLDGETFVDVSPSVAGLASFRAIRGRSSSDIYVVEANTIWHGQPGSWSDVTGDAPIVNHSLTHVRLAGNDMVIGGRGQVFSHDGSVWTDYEFPLDITVSETWGESGDDLFAATDSGLWHYDGAAGTDLEQPGDYRSIWGTSSTNVFAGSGAGGIVHYDGVEWRDLWTDDRGPVSAIHGDGPSDIFATTEGGSLLHFDGIAWAPIRGEFQGASALIVSKNMVHVLAQGWRRLYRSQPW